jgi:hypothetical protein
MEYEISYEKSMEGYLRSRKKIDWSQCSLLGTLYLLMEYSIPPSRGGKILEGKIIEHFGLTSSGVSDYDATISNGKGRIEIKTSVKNIETGRYTITNLREFKDFDFYLFCLIDPEERYGFKINYYLIPKKYIDNNSHIKFYNMNSGGTGKRFSFKQSYFDDTYSLIKRLNVLDKIRYDFDKDSANYGLFPYLSQANGHEYGMMDFVKYYDKFTHVILACDYSQYLGMDIPTYSYKTPLLSLTNSKKILKGTVLDRANKAFKLRCLKNSITNRLGY